MQRGRRHFIRGVAGSMLAIPFLPSLSRTARADEASPKRFVSIRSLYGQPEQLFYPGRPSNEVGDHVRHQTFAAGDVISPILGETFAPVAHKLSILRGVGLCSGDHNNHTMLAPGPRPEGQPPRTRTSMDELLAQSSLYDSPPPHRILRAQVRTGHGYSWRDGQRQPYDSVVALYRRLFPSSDVEDDATPRDLQAQRALNLALPGVERVRDGRQIGRADRERLSNYLQMLSDAERRLEARRQRLLACSDPGLSGTVAAGPGNHERHADRYHLYLEWKNAAYDTLAELTVAALACDMTRVVSISASDFGSRHGENGSTFHQPSHWTYQHRDPSDPGGDSIAFVRGSDEEARVLRMYRFVAGKVGRLMSLMDSVVDADGSTLLDGSLVYFGNELSGAAGHHDYSMPIVVAGTAGGRIQPGYWDFTFSGYARRARNRFFSAVGTQVYANFLVTLMHALGLPREEWESVQGGAGFGQIRVSNRFRFGGPSGDWSFEEIYGDDVTGDAARRRTIPHWFTDGSTG
ncbi:MAG: DUF1552 domain-containing protein [Myxococcota bacterium]